MGSVLSSEADYRRDGVQTFAQQETNDFQTQNRTQHVSHARDSSGPAFLNFTGATFTGLGRTEAAGTHAAIETNEPSYAASSHLHHGCHSPCRLPWLLTRELEITETKSHGFESSIAGQGLIQERIASRRVGGEQIILSGFLIIWMVLRASGLPRFLSDSSFNCYPLQLNPGSRARFNDDTGEQSNVVNARYLSKGLESPPPP